MNKSKEYAKNTIILLIGKFTTQFMTLFLLPIYTHYLITSDYGLVDLYQTYTSLFVPVFLLCLDSAVFRFLIDSRNNKDEIKNIVSSSLIRTIIQTIILIIISFIIHSIFDIKYYSFMMINIITVMFSNIFLQISRGLGQNKNYSVACIITGSTILISNLLLILKFNFGANSILISNSIGNILCIIYLFLTLKIYQYISIKKYSNLIIKKLLKYSTPLIPNALSWWIVNTSDRTLISIFLNTAYNGIYTVSCKFSNILNSIFGIFTMSWQESASLHINDDDREIFFSNMIDKILKIFASISLIIIVLLPILFNILIGKSYKTAYNYIPILILANTFNVLIGLFGGIYIAKKLTKKMTSTTIIAAIINIILNLLFIKKIGLYAASLSTLISYLCLAIYRYFDVQKYVKIKLNIKTIISIIIAFAISLMSYYINNLILNILTLFIIVCYSIYNNIEIIISFMQDIKSKIIKKKNYSRG